MTQPDCSPPSGSARSSDASSPPEPCSKPNMALPIPQVRIRNDQWNPPAIERTVAPLGHLLDDLVGDPGDGVLADARAVDLGKVRADLPGRQTSRGQRQHDLVNAVEPALPLTHDHRLE